MSLRKRWKELDREIVAGAPDRYALYELGDDEGESLGLAIGNLRDDLKEELAYGNATKVRWELANSKVHAERLLAEHTDTDTDTDTD